MSNTAEATIINTTVNAKPFGRQVGAIGFAIASFMVIHGISFVVWKLFVDPQAGIWKYYPQPFGASLFWAILVCCSVLNEVAIVPGFGGDPLTWVDLLNLILLLYVVYFGCYGLIKKEA